MLHGVAGGPDTYESIHSAMDRGAWLGSGSAVLLGDACVGGDYRHSGNRLGRDDHVHCYLDNDQYGPIIESAGPPWNGEVANGTSLMFAGCPSGVLGTAGCLDASPNSPNEAIEFAKNTPITGVLAANNPFVQFAGNGTSHANLLFTVTAIGPGSANTNCAGAVNVGDSCSPFPFPGSPLVLTKTAVGTNVSFGMFGTATDGVGSSTWSGQLESPFTGETPAQIQGLLATGSVTSSQSGEFVAASTTVPEPATISLLGIGLLGLGRGLRKRSTR